MLELREVSLSFGEKTVLRDCSLQLPAGSRTALLGPSGCGKTTLLRLMAGLLSPDRGSVRGSASRTAVLFQEPRLLPWLTALENVNAVLSDRPATIPAAEALLRRAGLGDALSLFPRALSGGMQQRVAICRMIAYGGDLFLLDEPLKGLDPDMAAQMAALILEAAAGKTLLVATHSAWEESALTDRRLCFRDGSFIPA